ncbi:MAG: tetraacyldisaccharide 4'-kinase [Armatimonadota bacterium]
MNGLAKLIRLIAFWPLSLLYAGGLELYLAWRLPRRQRLSIPVVCIGNISCGGTGKTPAVISIARHFVERGIRVAILSRGHGGHITGDYAVVSDGQSILLTPDQSGDEPYLIAQSLPEVPLLVGRDRRITGQAAIDRFHPQMLLLDDGFQYYQLQRDLDIVLLNGADPFEGGWPLPAGNLREPPSHLRRADALVLTGSDGQQMSLKPVQRIDLPKFKGTRQASCLRDTHGASVAVEWLQGRNVSCFSGLGHPEQFENSLLRLGAVLKSCRRLNDHQAITTTQLRQLWLEAKASGCEAMICTQKDMVKLPAGCDDLPIYALEIHMAFDEPFWSWLDARVAEVL